MHILFVSKYLCEKPIVLDSTEYPQKNLIYYKCAKGVINIFYKNHHLNNIISGVWYRKPGVFHNKDLMGLGLSQAQAEYSRGNINTSFLWLNDLLVDKVWVSKYRAIQRASNKLLQYKLATHLGFNVPSFVLTNNSIKAIDFINKHSQ